MGDPALYPNPATLSEEQKAAFLRILADDNTLGNKTALEMAGVTGTGIRALLTEELLEEAREARGWRIRGVEATTWRVAQDTSHTSWDRANARLLKAYGGPQFRDRQDLQVSGPEGGPIETTTEDKSARLTDVLDVIRKHVEEGDGGDGGDDPDTDVA